MATFSGNDGTVKSGANVIANILSWTLTEGVNTHDSTVIGATSDTHNIGTKNWSGTIECYWDDTDTTGQGTLLNGASVTLALLPEGSTTGDYSKSGTATITGISTGIALNGTNTASFTFTGNGDLTIGTAA